MQYKVQCDDRSNVECVVSEQVELEVLQVSPFVEGRSGTAVYSRLPLRLVPKPPVNFCALDRHLDCVNPCLHLFNTSVSESGLPFPVLVVLANPPLRTEATPQKPKCAAEHLQTDWSPKAGQ
jgi:hypothetical protein